MWWAKFLLLSELHSGIDLDNRKEFNRLLELVFDGRVETLVVTHLDRLSRVSASTLKSMFSRFGVEVIELNKKDETSLEEDLLQEISNQLYCYSAKSYGKRASEKRKFRMRDEDLEFIFQLADEGKSARQIHELMVEAEIKEEVTNQTPSYWWVSKLLTDRQKSRMAVAKSKASGKWADSNLRQFFYENLKPDSNGKEWCWSQTVKQHFLTWAKAKGIAVDDSHPYWWARLLKENGISGKKENGAMKIYGWSPRE